MVMTVPSSSGIWAKASSNLASMKSQMGAPGSIRGTRSVYRSRVNRFFGAAANQSGYTSGSRCGNHSS